MGIGMGEKGATKRLVMGKGERLGVWDSLRNGWQRNPGRTVGHTGDRREWTISRCGERGQGVGGSGLIDTMREEGGGRNGQMAKRMRKGRNDD